MANLIRFLVYNVLSPVATGVFKHNLQINRCNVLMIIHSNKYSFVHRSVDVTGVTSIGECIPMQSVQMRGSNISFGTVGGNPSSVLGQEGEMDGVDHAASVGSDESMCSTGSFDLFSRDHHFTDRY